MATKFIEVFNIFNIIFVNFFNCASFFHVLSRDYFIS